MAVAPDAAAAMAEAMRQNQERSNAMAKSPMFAGASMVTNTGIDVGPESQNVKCPNCEQQVFTVTEKKPGIMAWIVGAALCALGCWCCACIPCCCVEKWQAVNHTCPECKGFVGKYQQQGMPGMP